VDCVARDDAVEVVKRDFDAPGFDALTASQQDHVKSVFDDRAAEPASGHRVTTSIGGRYKKTSAAAESSSDSDTTRVEWRTKPGRERVFDSSSDDSDAPEPPPPARAPRKRSAAEQPGGDAEVAGVRPHGPELVRRLHRHGAVRDRPQ
jgi:hypothetical protein